MTVIQLKLMACLRMLGQVQQHSSTRGHSFSATRSHPVPADSRPRQVSFPVIRVARQACFSIPTKRWCTAHRSQTLGLGLALLGNHLGTGLLFAPDTASSTTPCTRTSCRTTKPAIRPTMAAYSARLLTPPTTQTRLSV